MKRLLICIIIAGTFVLQGQAQDMFFSQFYSAPLVLNPALTGFMAGDMQVSMNYRNQTKSLIPASVYAASCDFKIAKDVTKPDVFAIGLFVARDNVQGGAVRTSNYLASLAFHKALDQQTNHYIALGAQIGAIQHTFNPDLFTYDKQFIEGVGFDASQLSGEVFSSQNGANFELNSGFFYYGRIKKYSAIYAGASMYHITNPKQTFLSEKAFYARRFVAHMGSRIQLNQQMFMIPNLIFMTQNAAHFYMEGTSFEYRVGDTRSFFRIGAWFKHSDKPDSDQTVVFSAGIRIIDFQFGVSSDFLSPLQSDSRTKGAVEFSIIYSPFFKTKANLKPDPTRNF